MKLDAQQIQEVVVAYSCVALWISLSAGVILYNKYLLTTYGFDYPVALTLMHMGFCSIVAITVVRGFEWVKSINMDTETYMKSIVPIGGLYALTLWLGNTAYLYLSVSFIQMLKALMPVSVFVVGVIVGTEIYTNKIMFNMIVVTIGVMIASYGELNFVLIGVLVQLGSLLCESTRLTLVQILLQRKGLKLNPFTTMYYISPACFMFLLVPFIFIEAPRMSADLDLKFDPLLFFGNCCVALALNLAVFLLIGKTSALSMNVAGVVKDWMLIGLSSLLFAAPVSAMSLGGYMLAFAGVGFYNYQKLQMMTGDSKEGIKPDEAKPSRSDSSSGLLASVEEGEAESAPVAGKA